MTLSVGSPVSNNLFLLHGDSDCTKNDCNRHERGAEEEEDAEEGDAAGRLDFIELDDVVAQLDGETHDDARREDCCSVEDDQALEQRAFVVDEIHPVEEEQEQTEVFHIIQDVKGRLQKRKNANDEDCFGFDPESVLSS